MKQATTVSEHAIDLVRRAARANLEDPFLRGKLIELPSEGDLLVTGDLHGSHANYERILKLADLASRPDRHLILQEITHDTRSREKRLCRSWQVLEMAARLKSTFPEQTHFLFANHDMAELCGLSIAKEGADLNERFADALDRAYGADAPRVMEAYKEFWRTMPLAAATRHGTFLAHSTPRLSKMDAIDREWFRSSPEASRYQRDSAVYDLTWGRDYSKAAAEEFARRVEAEVLIVAHTKCHKGYRAPNDRHIIMDSSHPKGCYALLPLDQPLSHREIVSRIRRLNPAAQSDEFMLEW